MSENSSGTQASTPPERVERGVRVVPAPAADIFDLLADPSRHHEFDGSGTVRSSAGGAPERLGLGATFGMNMRLGIPYRVTNEVVEFVEPEVIAWRHMGGHVWRFRLRPVEGGTEVTEEFDWGPSRVPWALKAIRAPSRNAAAIEATLDRVVRIFDAGSISSGS